jgi:hypothetical protein
MDFSRARGVLSCARAMRHASASQISASPSSGWKSWMNLQIGVGDLDHDRITFDMTSVAKEKLTAGRCHYYYYASLGLGGWKTADVIEYLVQWLAEFAGGVFWRAYSQPPVTRQQQASPEDEVRWVVSLWQTEHAQHRTRHSVVIELWSAFRGPLVVRTWFYTVFQKYIYSGIPNITV